MQAAPQYEVEDRSILLPHYRRFLVDPVLRHVPARLDPNVITHFGHALCLGSLLVTIASGASASWTTFVAVALLLSYLWCDNADGTHARRTGQTSTGGEYLDHGLDLLNCAYIGIISAYALGAPTSTPGIVVASLIAGAAALTTWEQAVTGVFRLGTLNQIESLTFLSLVLVADALFGTELLRRPLLFGVTAQHVIFAFVTISITFNIVRGFVLVRRAGRELFAGVAFAALHVGIYAAHATGRIGTVPAFGIVTSTSIAFGTRMLSTRLRRARPSSTTGWVLAAAGIASLAASQLFPPSVISAGALVLAAACFVSACNDAFAIVRRLDTLKQDQPSIAAESRECRTSTHPT